MKINSFIAVQRGDLLLRITKHPVLYNTRLATKKPITPPSQHKARINCQASLQMRTCLAGSLAETKRRSSGWLLVGGWLHKLKLRLRLCPAQSWATVGVWAELGNSFLTTAFSLYF